MRKFLTSGMAAVHTALVGLVAAGDHVVAAKALFGSSRWILGQWAPRFGVEVTLVDAADLVLQTTKVRHPMDAGQKGQRGIEW